MEGPIHLCNIDLDMSNNYSLQKKQIYQSCLMCHTTWMDIKYRKEPTWSLEGFLLGVCLCCGGGDGGVWCLELLHSSR